MKLILALILLLGMASATTNYTQDAQAFTRPISFLNNVTFHGPIDISNSSPITTEGAITGTTINASDGFTGDLTGTASRVPIGTFLDTGYGLENSSNKIRVNLTTNDGLEFGTGADEGSLGIKTGTGLDTGATGVTVDTTDILDTASGLSETATNKAGVNLSDSSGLGFGSGATEGALKIVPADASLALVPTGVKVGANKIHLNVIAGGTAGDHDVAGIVSGDELDGVLYVAKGAENLTAVTDVYSEYSINATAGKISNWDGSTSAGGYLIVAWLDRTA